MAGKGNPKTGGRKRGTPNKRTQQVQDRLAELECDPVEGMVKLAYGDADCLVCDDGFVTVPQFYKLINKPIPKFELEDESGNEAAAEVLADRKCFCPNCGGTKREPISSTLSGKMFVELLQYVAPKRKAIEMTGNMTMTHEERVLALLNGDGSSE